MIGFAGIHVALTEKRAALAWLWEALGKAQITVAVNSISLDSLAEAWRAQTASPHAKYVVVPSHGDTNSGHPTDEKRRG